MTLGSWSIRDKCLAMAIAVAMCANIFAFIPSPAMLFGARPVVQVRAPQLLIPDLSIENQDTAVDAIVKKPIFNSNRQPDPKPTVIAAGVPSAPAATPLGDLTQLRLVGLMLSASEKIALIRLPDARQILVRAGDTLDGWSIKDVYSDGVTLEGQGRTGSLTIPRAANGAPSVGTSPQKN